MRDVSKRRVPAMDAVERPGAGSPPGMVGMLHVIAASFRAELRAQRATASPLLHFAVLIGLAALIVPGPDAGHTLVSLGAEAVGLNADTAVAAAGAVIGVLAIPVYACTLGVGHGRDRRSGVGDLLTATGTRPALVYAGRVLVNLATGCLAVAAACVGAQVMAFLSYGFVPGASAGAAFMLLALPPLILAVALGAAGDRLFPFRNIARVAVMMFLWFALLTASVAVPNWDLVGLAGLIPGGAEAGVGFGISAMDAVPNVRWEIVQLSPDFLGNRAAALAAMAVAVIAVLFIVPASRGAERQRQSRRAIAAATDAAAAEYGGAQRLAARGGASFAAVVFVTVAHWFRRAPMCVVAFALGLAAPQFGPAWLAIPLALLVPLAVVAKSDDEHPGLRDLLWTTAALFMPTPTLFRLGILAALTLASAAFALADGGLQDGGLQKSITVFAALCGMTLLLVWANESARWRRGGILAFVVLWYVGSFGGLDGEADFLGVSTGSRLAILVWAGWCVLGLACLSLSAGTASRRGALESSE